VEFLSLFQALAIPPAFARERLQSVSHSFGFRNDHGGSCAWFHFLCKHIEVTSARTPTGPVPMVVHHPVTYHPAAKVATLSTAATIQGSNETLATSTQVGMTLPQADYSYTRSGFFLRANNKGAVTLCCFGATDHVRKRFDRFIDTKAWKEIPAEPYMLFDLIIDGLFLEVDQNVWNMNMIFGALEHVSHLAPDLG
jgi:hypothetical protein